MDHSSVPRESGLSFVGKGAIDCDVHPHVPHIRALFPYLDDYWRDMADTRGMDGFQTLSLIHI